METRADTWIFNTAEKRFQRGSVSFSDRFEEVSLDDTSSSFQGGECVIPGLVDIHMHIESSMLTPTAFAQASLPHGTTTIVSDCHEVANVAGEEGLKQFMALPVSNSTFYAIPSSVPASSSDLETSGGSFDEREVTELCAEKRVIALGEVMNANDLFSPEDNRTKRIIRAFRAARSFSPIEGHCPRLAGSDLNRFIRSGVDSDHTEQTPDSVREKIEKGMFLELQYKSITPEVIHALKPCYDGLFSLCTDDVLPDVLVTEGQLDRVLRKGHRLRPLSGACHLRRYLGTVGTDAPVRPWLDRPGKAGRFHRVGRPRHIHHQPSIRRRPPGVRPDTEDSPPTNHVRLSPGHAAFHHSRPGDGKRVCPSRPPPGDATDPDHRAPGGEHDDRCPRGDGDRS
jgi:hypothetical protein